MPFRVFSQSILSGAKDVYFVVNLFSLLANHS